MTAAPGRWCLATLASVALLASAGCGDDDEPGYCDVLRDFARINAELPNAADLARLDEGERRDVVDETREVYERIGDEAPDEVSADAEDFAAAQLVISRAIEDADYDASALDPTDPAVTEAVRDVERTAPALQSYARTECGGLDLSSTGR